MGTRNGKNIIPNIVNTKPAILIIKIPIPVRTKTNTTAIQKATTAATTSAHKAAVNMMAPAKNQCQPSIANKNKIRQIAMNLLIIKFHLKSMPEGIIPKNCKHSVTLRFV